MRSSTNPTPSLLGLLLLGACAGCASTKAAPNAAGVAPPGNGTDSQATPTAQFAPNGGSVRPLGSKECLPMQIGTDGPAGFKSWVFEWRDARCDRRSAALVSNDSQDPKGKWGGYLRTYRYQVDGATRSCTSENDEHPGFGYVVSHWNKSASVGYNTRGRYETPLYGPHHAVHRYTWKGMPIQGQPVDVTIQWFFATGRDHPVWAITYDMSGIPADTLEADTRAPYGDFAWDGGSHAPVAGVAWGDRYRFRSMKAPVSMKSGWDYSQPNTIPFAMEWSEGPDAEMGMVQTQTYLQHDAGGYWNYKSWGKSSTEGPMPEDWNWAYQLNQYELPFNNTTKRIAWGSNYGALGKRNYPAFGDDRQVSGWPFQSYAVFVVLGKHSTRTVEDVVTGMETVEDTKIRALQGAVATDGPAGVSRTDNAVYAPPGWDPVHAAWTLVASNGRAEVAVSTVRPLKNAMFHLRGLADGDLVVARDGEALTAGVDFFATEDRRDASTWVTLERNLSGDQTLYFAARAR